MPATLRRGTFCLFACALTSLQAEERTFGPKDLVSELLQNNPKIQAARSRFEAATKRPSRAGALPEPTASYTNFGVGHPFSRLNASEFTYQGLGVSQQLPFPRRLRRGSEGSKNDVECEQQNCRSVVLDVSTRLKVADYESSTTAPITLECRRGRLSAQIFRQRGNRRDRNITSRTGNSN
jgi:outer membrane protein TolC